MKKALELKDGKLKYLKDRNMSILDFNMRVLMMACDENVPIVERLTFIKIVFSNLDEFISIKLPESSKVDHDIYMKYIAHIYSKMHTVFMQNIEASGIKYGYEKIDFENHDSQLFNDEEVYYVTVGNSDTFSVYKCNGMSKDEMDQLMLYKNNKDKVRYSFLVRFISDKSFRYLYSGEGTDQLVEEIDSIVEIKKNIVFTHIQTTCENSQIMDKFLEQIKISLSGYFYISEQMIQINHIMEYITKNYTDKRLYYPKFIPQYTERDYYKDLLSKDIMVYNPYISYNEVLDFINQMCSNPNIDSIFVTLYRTSDKSQIIESLLKAKELGKEVFVYIEPTARGNEESNINIITRLTEVGVNVSCNYFNYKIHSKIFIAVDKSGVLYSHIGTGNYNETTARLYTDLHLLTTDMTTNKPIYTLFKNVFQKAPLMNTKKFTDMLGTILVAPITLRPSIIKLIESETLKGSKGKIYFKCNSLCDKTIIELLYKAAERGVEVKLLVRTAVGILPTDNLEIRSKVGRFLEHERIYIFGESTYISSADLLIRNIDRRIEVTARVNDRVNRAFIESIFMKKWDSPNAYILHDTPIRWESNK